MEDRKYFISEGEKRLLELCPHLPIGFIKLIEVGIQSSKSKSKKTHIMTIKSIT